MNLDINKITQYLISNGWVFTKLVEGPQNYVFEHPNGDQIILNKPVFIHTRNVKQHDSNFLINFQNVSFANDDLQIEPEKYFPGSKEWSQPRFLAFIRWRKDVKAILDEIRKIEYL